MTVFSPARFPWACLAAVLALACHSTPAASLANGGFEAGEQGWMWEQWSNKPLPGKIDSTVSKEGKNCFLMGMPGNEGGRYLAKELPIENPAQDHVLKFWLRVSDVPERAARVALAIPDRGFLAGGDLVRTGGTQDWREYKFAVKAADLAGAGKVTIFFYHDRIGHGAIAIDNLSFAAGILPAGEASALPPAGEAAPAAKGVTLTGDTSKPETSTYALGETIDLHFKTTDLPRGASGLKLSIAIVDEYERPIESKEIPVEPDADGSWQTEFTAPSSKLGFYRVQAKLSNGVPLQSLGTRPPGFLTYAVVPDPAERKDYGEKESMFAMQGGFGAWGDRVLAYLGARWVLDGSLEWKKKEPDHAGQFDPETELKKIAEQPPKVSAWKKYPLPTLFAAPKWAVKPETLSYMTGSLTPEGEKAWDAYCRKAARVFAARNPDLAERIYQITWEPIRPWGYKGTDEELLRIHEIAYKALHESDPKAVVAGPTQGLKEQGLTFPLLKAGLPKYIDAFSIHPYFPITPERDGMVKMIRSLKAGLAAFSSKPLPLLGTEQGHSTEEDPAKELTHARGLIRQNLITLGEGFQFNFAFYITDYRMAGQKGYGYYYNLASAVPFGPDKVAPRPIVPAYAAQSLLIDGHASAGAIEWLGETALGYAFQRGENVVLALWDYGDQPGEVSIPAGNETAKVYDWMGNLIPVSSNKGDLLLKLGPEPVYVAGVSPKLWGGGSGRWFVTPKEQPVGYPGTKALLQAALRAPEAFKGTLVASLDKRLGQQEIVRPVSMAKGASTVCELGVDIPANAKPGRYPVQLVLKDEKGASVAVSGLGMTIEPPLTIVSIDPPDISKGEHAVTIVLRNDRPAPTSGTAAFEIRYVNGATVSKEYALEPGATQRVVLPLPPTVNLSPLQAYQTQATANTSDGFALQQGAMLNFLTARRMPAKPKAEPDASDWKAPVIRLGGASAVAGPAEHFSGDQDLSANLRFAWDEEALYVLAEVTDDVFVQPHRGEKTHQADALRLAVNLDPRKKEEVSGNLLADVAERPRSSELTVALTEKGPEVFRNRAADPDLLPAGPLSAEDARAAVSKEPDKIVYEVAIPWRTLGLRKDEVLKPGEIIGIALALNDADSEAEKPVTLGLYGAIAPTKSQIRFGLMVLGEKP